MSGCPVRGAESEFSKTRARGTDERRVVGPGLLNERSQRCGGFGASVQLGKAQTSTKLSTPDLRVIRRNPGLYRFFEAVVYAMPQIINVTITYIIITTIANIIAFGNIIILIVTSVIAITLNMTNILR